MKHTANINGPTVVAWVLIFVAAVALAVYVGSVIQEATKKRVQKRREQRADTLVFRNAQEARNDFN